MDRRWKEEENSSTTSTTLVSDEPQGEECIPDVYKERSSGLLQTGESRELGRGRSNPRMGTPDEDAHCSHRAQCREIICRKCSAEGV
eukprot:1757652-Amphidinium_carterae.1